MSTIAFFAMISAVLDVRDEEAFTRRHKKGSANIPWRGRDQMDNDIHQLPPKVGILGYVIDICSHREQKYTL